MSGDFSGGDGLKGKMIFITAFLAVGFAVILPVFILTESSLVETFLITFGVALYHFAMRLLVGTVVDLIMKNRADASNIWFREKRFEAGLYAFFRVRKWKKHLPTYSPDTFDTAGRTLEELIGATCQAEAVHEIIMVFSLLPICFIPLLGGAAAMIMTSVSGMLFDSLFVMIQRYNRPRLIRLLERQRRAANVK